jgi:glutathione S-transferase
MPDIVLHHYNPSPYSEKIRAVLGYKQLAWQSVLTPSMLPKPQLQALTGGYRGAPVMQIGADVYCDSALIARELDRRWPAPSLFPSPAQAGAVLIGAWADAWLFWKSVRLSFGLRAEQLPAEFVADRAAMVRSDMFDMTGAKAEVAHARGQLMLACDQLERALARSACLAGEVPGYDDFAVYHCLWFAARADRGLLVPDRHPRVIAWMAQLAALGHGQREEIDADQAIAIARAAEPAPLGPARGQALPGDPEPGARVSVRPESFGTERTLGTVVAIDGERITLARDSEAAGRVHVHFPRLGYLVAAV